MVSFGGQGTIFWHFTINKGTGLTPTCKSRSICLQHWLNATLCMFEHCYWNEFTQSTVTTPSNANNLGRLSVYLWTMNSHDLKACHKVKAGPSSGL